MAWGVKRALSSRRADSGTPGFSKVPSSIFSISWIYFVERVVGDRKAKLTDPQEISFVGTSRRSICIKCELPVSSLFGLTRVHFAVHPSTLIQMELMR